MDSVAVNRLTAVAAIGRGRGKRHSRYRTRPASVSSIANRRRDAQMRRSRMARVAAAVREGAPSLARMAATWREAARRLTSSAAAISLSVRPSTSRRRTSTSRGVRPAVRRRPRRGRDRRRRRHARSLPPAPSPDRARAPARPPTPRRRPTSPSRPAPPRCPASIGRCSSTKSWSPIASRRAAAAPKRRTAGRGCPAASSAIASRSRVREASVPLAQLPRQRQGLPIARDRPGEVAELRARSCPGCRG